MCPQIPERFATSAPVPPPKCVPTDAMDTAPRAPRRRGWRALLPAGLALIIAARLWAHFPVSEVTNNSHANSHANNSVFGDADSPPDFPLTGAPDGASWSHFRLPRHAVPSHYRITLATELYADEFHDGGEGIGTGSSASPFEFAGFVEMDFVVLNSTDFMVINAADLQLGRAEIAVRGPREESPVFHPVPQNVTSDEQILLRFSSPAFSPPANTSPSVLEPGTSYTLRIAFSGVLEESLMGYYRSSYERGGRTHWLGSTQFESTDARRAFPCLDEPIFKARFSLISYTRPKFHTLFNMPEIDNSVGPAPAWWPRNGRWRRTEFSATPPMSTYIVAYVVSEFEHISEDVKIPSFSETKSDVGAGDHLADISGSRTVKISVYFEPGLRHTAPFALDVAKVVLPFYSRLYRIAYPLPKLDLIAIPDFAAGAMENFGLVTFRSTALLYDPARSSTRDKQGVAATVAHELAHLWTGDLVTMSWWSQLWLNEGFAQYIENIGAEEFGRTSDVDGWLMEQQFFAGEEEGSLWEDAGMYTHAVVNKNLRTPAEIEEAFDAITYSKGSSLIRMLRAWVNEAKKNATKPHHSEQVLLRQGSSRQRPLITPAKPPFSLLSHPDPRHPDYFFRRMHSYLSTYAYSTATTADLWSKLDMHRHNLTNDSSPVFGVEKTMSTWTDQEGFPVVIMTPLPDGSLHVRQERHLHAHCCRNASELPGQDSIWWIPFQFQVYTNATHDGTPVPHGPPRTVLLTERETVIQDVGHCNDASSGCEMRLVKANFHQTAFYRVQYPPGDLAVFADWIEKSFFLPPVGRAGLLSDAISMSLSGRSDDIEATLLLFDKMLTPLLAEEDYVVWSVTIASIQRAFFHGAFEIHPSYGLVKKWLQQLVKPAIKQIGWDEERKDPHVRRLLRTALLRFAVAVGERKTLKEARRLFKGIANGEVDVRRADVEDDGNLSATWKPAVTPDVLDVIYDSAMLGGNQREHELLQALFLNATFATEEQRILHAMCLAKPLFLVRRNLAFVTSPAVRLQDTFRALIWITSSSYEANFEVWTFFMENWEDLMEGHKYNLGQIGQKFGEVLKVIASTLGSPVHIAAMRDWFKREFGLCSTKDEDRFSDPDPDCRHTMPRMAGLYVKKGLEIAEMRMKFVERFGDRIGTWVERTLRERSRGKGREDHAEEGTEE